MIPLAQQVYYIWEEGAGDCYRSTHENPEISGNTYVLDLIINRDGQNVTGTTLSVLVGQKMNLQAVLTAPPPELDSSQTSWTIPGFRLANYVDDQNNAVITPLNNLTNNNTIIYSWLDAGDNRVVKFDVSFPNLPDLPTPAITKSVTFDVKRPTAEVTAVTVSPQIITTNPPLLAFRTPSTPGISFSRTVTMPPSFPGGELKWVQKISSTLRRRKSFPGNNWSRTEAANVLDNTNPYDPGISVSDSPAVELLPGFTEYTVNDHYEMYLMFKPAGNGSIWVPLRRVLWYWNVGATRNAITGNWSLAANPTYSNSPASEDVIIPPQWVGNITSYGWVPE